MKEILHCWLWRWLEPCCNEGGWPLFAESGPRLTANKEMETSSYSSKELNLANNKERNPWKELNLGNTVISALEALTREPSHAMPRLPTYTTVNLKTVLFWATKLAVICYSETENAKKKEMEKEYIINYK